MAFNRWIQPGEAPAHARIYYDMIDKAARPVTAPPEFAELEKLVLDTLKQVTANQVSVKSAMDNLNRQITELLSKRTPPAA